MIRIVSDSTCDFPPARLAELGVHIVPIHLFFGSDEYQEGVTLGYHEFYRKVDELGIVPKTSQPAPSDFVLAYRQLAAEGAREILSIHVTGKLSGTVRSAQMAADIVRDEVKVHVFDSLCGSTAMAFMVEEACEMLAAGAGSAEVLARWEAIRPTVRILFYLDTLKYARMSGRVGALQSSFAAMLQIKPLITLNDGVLEMSERVRSRRAALERLTALAAQHAAGRPLKLAVVHAEDPVGAQALLAQIQQTLDCRQALICPLATSLVVNLGVGTLGIAFYPEL
ncbi:MAG: DegV family protein [Caldilineales bacterium]